MKQPAAIALLLATAAVFAPALAADDATQRKDLGAVIALLVYRAVNNRSGRTSALR